MAGLVPAIHIRSATILKSRRPATSAQDDYTDGG